MSFVKPKTWVLRLTAGAPTKLTPVTGVVFASVIVLHNKTTGIVRLGGEGSQDWEIPAGGQFEMSNIDEPSGETSSEISTADVYLNASVEGDVVVLATIWTED